MKIGRKMGRPKQRNDSKDQIAKRFAFGSLLLSVCFVFLAFSAASAAEFQISASLDRNQMTMSEQAVLSVTVSGSGSQVPDPQLPALPDFQVYNAGRSQNFTWINGKASASVTHNFVLTPSKEGQFTIPPIRLESQGEQVETPSLALAVAKGDPSAVQGTARREGALPTAPAAQGAPAVFITGTVDKNHVVVGEPITFTFRLYNRVPLLSRPSYQPPETAGFWSEDLPPQRNFTAHVKGMPYNVTEVRTALFASTPGKSRIGPAQLGVSLENFGTDPFGSNFFAQFFGRGEEKVLRTDPIQITVKPLPEPKPSDFKGAVGTYSLRAEVDKQKIAVGQPLTLSITVSGRGNIKSIPDVSLPALTNFRTFDANAATNIEKKEGAVEGSKVFKTVLIPTATGELAIPPVSFSFYDIATRSYRTVRSNPIRIHVEAGSQTSMASPEGMGSSVSSLPGSAQPGIKRLGDDIRYIHTPETIDPASGFLYQKRWFRLLYLTLFGILGLGLLARLYHRFFRSNTTVYRFRKAKEKALADAKETEAYLSKKDVKAASSHLANLLQDFMAAKLGVDRRSQSLKQIVEGLKRYGLSSHTGEKVRSVWETLDLYQFAPAQVQEEELRSALGSVTHVIEEVEKEITWKK
jgi:hypothetical protein